MLRYLLAVCLMLFASPCFAVTLQVSCTFSNQNGGTYTTPQLCSQPVAVFPDNAKSTANDKYYVGAGPNECIYYVTCLQKGSMYLWSVAIADKRGFAVVQSGIITPSNASCSGPVKSSTATTRALIGASDGNFFVLP